MTVRRFRQATAYVQACYWIARNDEPGEIDPEIVQHSLTVLLVAELFGKPPLEVAKDVVSRRFTTVTEAAAALLAKLDDMTTEQFSRGEERIEREALRAALARHAEQRARARAYGEDLT